jgi:hypothetical protein
LLIFTEEKARLEAEEEAARNRVRQERKQKKLENKKKKDLMTAEGDAMLTPAKKDGKDILKMIHCDSDIVFC